MKKEFKAIENITCRFFNLINAEDAKHVSDMVIWKIRTEELSKLENDKDYKAIVKSLDDDFSVIPEQASDKQILTACDNDKDFADLFKSHLENIQTAREAVKATGISLDQFNSLESADKVFITLEAHKNLASITIDAGEADFTKAVNAYFNKGEMKQAKDLLRSAFNSCCGKAGKYFTGVKIKKSDISDKDVRSALSGCVKDAKRTEQKMKDGNKKLNNYDWVRKSDKKTIDKVVSSLFGVVLESRTDQIEKVMPKQTEKQETKTEKQETK